MSGRPIRLLAILEAATVTGPARNLLEFCRVAREMEDRRVETSIVTYRLKPYSPRDEFLDATAAAGIETYVIGERAAFDPRVKAMLCRIVERRNPDIVQTHSVKSHFWLRMSGLARRKPWVAFHHGYTFQDAKMRAYNLLDRWSLRAPSRIVTVSRAFAEQLSARGVPPARITVLHNAIDPEWLSISREEARRKLAIGSGQPLVVAVGRLSREKAFDRLLEAFAYFLGENAAGEPLLIIVGEGLERGNLERQIAARGLTGRVRLTGQIARVQPFYAAADVVAISSSTEGSPNVLLEAMAARVPVVATTVGGIPEIVANEESALLVPPGDVAAFAGALARIFAHRDEAHARAERAHRLIVERHSPQARARYLAGLYAELTRL
jgi:glycosyltransferase involved in cell wall biosynthesis